RFHPLGDVAHDDEQARFIVDDNGFSRQNKPADIAVFAPDVHLEITDESRPFNEPEEFLAVLGVDAHGEVNQRASDNLVAAMAEHRFPAIIHFYDRATGASHEDEGVRA